MQLLANAKYDGGGKANIKTVNLLPFTTTDAEENALRAGTVDYGYINATNLSQEASFTAKGYTLKPWAGWAITYMPYNFNNPRHGPPRLQAALRPPGDPDVRGPGDPVQGHLQRHRRLHLRARPAGPDLLLRLRDAEEQPVPPLLHRQGAQAAHRPRLDRAERHDGLHRRRSGDDQCGAGVDKGTKFTMQVLSQSGSTVTDNLMSALQSSFAKSGIGFGIKTAPVNSVLSQAGQCKAGDSGCKWQLSFFGSAGSWYFPRLPER